MSQDFSSSSSDEANVSDWSKEFKPKKKKPLKSPTIEPWTYDPSKEKTDPLEPTIEPFDPSIDYWAPTPPKKTGDESDISPVEDTYEDITETPKKKKGLKSPTIYPWPDDTEEEKTESFEGKTSAKQGQTTSTKMDLSKFIIPSVVFKNIGQFFFLCLNQKYLRIVNSVYQTTGSLKLK